MMIEILFSGIKDITNLYKSKEVDKSDLGKALVTKTKYLGKEYSEKVLTDVVEEFEEEKSIYYGFFCKCWGRRKQRSFGKNQMRTAF